MYVKIGRVICLYVDKWNSECKVYYYLDVTQECRLVFMLLCENVRIYVICYVIKCARNNSEWVYIVDLLYLQFAFCFKR
jgi:hypothetical protein